MTLLEMISLYREETGDKVIPYMADDDHLVRYANEAEDQACRRAKLLIDSKTDSICRIALVESQSEYPIDSRVLQIRKLRLTGKEYPVDRVVARIMDWYKPGWESAIGQVSAYIPDYNSRSIRIYKTPNADAIIATPEAWMTVVRLPLVKMALSASVTFQDAGDTVTQVAHGRLGGDRVEFSVINGTTGISTYTEYFIRDVTADTYKLSATIDGSAISLTTTGSGTALYGSNGPEIEEKHHADLIHWMKYRAYGYNYADAYSDMSNRHYNLFESVFGPVDKAVDADLLPIVNGVAR